MKLFLILALIINVNGYGVIPETGLDVTVTEAEYDDLTDQTVMSLDGTLTCDAPLTLSITRSQAGMVDEFCCAGACRSGNGQTSETMNFNPKGDATWFAHYYPASASNLQVTYRFSDGTDTRELRVRYRYETQGVETITNHQSPITNKILKDGQVLIIKNNQTYRIL